MTILYRDDSVVVTPAYLQINGQTWRLSELEYVWHRQARPDWRVRSRMAGRGLLNIFMILAGMAAVVLLVAVIASAYLELKISSVPTNTLIVVAILLFILAFAPLVWEWALTRVDSSYDKGDAIYEMWAQTYGRRVLLLRLSDETRFNKIYRALQRALEDAEA